MHSALVSLLLLAPAVTAQAVYSPANFGPAEAPTYAYSGIGGTQSPSVLQTVHDDMQGTARTLRGISFRRDGQNNFGDYPAATILATVILSNAATDASTISATFASNHGANKTTVNNFSLVQFPATTYKGFVSAFDYRIPFTTPYSFNGNTPLCVEIRVNSHTHTGVNWYFDYAYNATATPPLNYVYYGTGCKATGSATPAAMYPSGSTNWPGSAANLTYNAYYLPKNTLVTLILGANNKTLGGLPLPIALPGTAGATSGTCTLYQDILTSIPALSDGTGQMSMNLGFSITQYFNGLSVFGQVVAPDAAANKWGLVLSNVTEHHIVAPYPTIDVSCVTADGSAGPTGTVHSNQGYVVKFDT